MREWPLTADEVRSWVDKRFRFMPGWSFTVRDGFTDSRVHLDMVAAVPDAYRAGETTVLDVHVPLPPFYDEHHLQEFLHWRIQRLWAHEVDEFFTVDGDRPYNPHRANADRDQPPWVAS